MTLSVEIDTIAPLSDGCHENEHPNPGTVWCLIHVYALPDVTPGSSCISGRIPQGEIPPDVILPGGIPPGVAFRMEFEKMVWFSWAVGTFTLISEWANRDAFDILPHRLDWEIYCASNSKGEKICKSAHLINCVIFRSKGIQVVFRSTRCSRQLLQHLTLNYCYGQKYP